MNAVHDLIMYRHVSELSVLSRWCRTSVEVSTVPQRFEEQSQTQRQRSNRMIISNRSLYTHNTCIARLVRNKTRKHVPLWENNQQRRPVMQPNVWHRLCLHSEVDYCPILKCFVPLVPKQSANCDDFALH